MIKTLKNWEIPKYRDLNQEKIFYPSESEDTSETDVEIINEQTPLKATAVSD